MKQLIGIIAAALVFVAYTPYIKDTLKAKTKPHPYSWFVWGFLTLIIFALQTSHGAGPGAYVTFTVGALSLFIAFLGLKHGKTDITRSDTVFFVAALLATGVWLFAKEPALSMVLLVSIDMLGFAPTIRKAWHKPNEETLITWEINAFRHGLSVLAIQEYSLITLLNPVVWMIANIAFSLMLVFRRKANRP